MALTKEKTNPYNGVTTTYHKVGSASVRGSILSCALESYTSQEYRVDGRSVDSNSYQFEITLEEEESMGIRQLAYKKIKELPEWEGAEDC